MERKAGQGEGGSGVELEAVEEGRAAEELAGLSTSDSSGEEEGETVSWLFFG